MGRLMQFLDDSVVPQGAQSNIQGQSSQASQGYDLSTVGHSQLAFGTASSYSQVQTSYPAYSSSSTRLHPFPVSTTSSYTQVRSSQIYPGYGNSLAMNSYLNSSTASNGGQTPYSGSLNGTQGSNGNGYSSPDYLSPYPFRPQLAILFKDPRTFYSNHTSDLQFPARASQAAASSNNMLTQVNIRNWFLDPAPSGLQSYMIATVNDAARCTEMENLLVSVTGLSRDSILSVMLVACTYTLNPFIGGRRVKLDEKWAIGSRARNILLKRMSVPWRRDTTCRLWLDVALGVDAKFAVSEWKKGYQQRS